MIKFTTEEKEILKELIEYYRNEINEYKFTEIIEDLYARLIDDARCEYPELYLLYHLFKEKNIDILKYINYIPGYFFAYDKYLTKITIPDNIEEIGYSAFEGCSSLKEINLPDNNNSNTISNNTFNDCKQLEKIFLPDSVEVIDYSAFMDCVNLKEVLLNQSASELEMIDEDAFTGCGSLVKLMLPNHRVNILMIGCLLYSTNKNLKIYGDIDNINIIGEEDLEQEDLKYLESILVN